MSCFGAKVTLALTAVVTFAMPSIAIAQASYRFAVVDATTTTKRLPPASMQLLFDDDEPELTISGTTALATSAGEFKQVQVVVDAGTNYWSRKILVKQAGIKRKAVNEFAAEPKPTRFTTQYLSGGTRRFDQGNIDKALAFFEQAFNGDPDRKEAPVLDDYEVILRYNYARALQQACLLLQYDTCMDARNRFTQILHDMSNRNGERIFASNGIPKQLVETALADLDSKEIKNRYAQALAARDARSYAEAAAVMKSLLDDFPKAQQAFTANRLTKEQLEADINLMNTRQSQLGK